MNQKYHDLKHQINLLKAEAGSGKSVEYLEQMEKEIRSYEAQNKTGNKVLDAVLTSKSLYCQNRGIGFTCVADGTLLDSCMRWISARSSEMCWIMPLKVWRSWGSRRRD